MALSVSCTATMNLASFPVVWGLGTRLMNQSPMNLLVLFLTAAVHWREACHLQVQASEKYVFFCCCSLH